MDKRSPPHPDAPGLGDSLLKTFAASAAVLVAGLALLLGATDLGQALTTETLRRAEVARAPRALPDLGLRDADGRSTLLNAYRAADARVWIVDFVYTRCTSVCSAQGSVYQQLQRQLLERGLQHQVGLLSISFDAERDNPAALRDYAARLQMAPDAWRILSLASPQERRRLLGGFGIMVLPAPGGEYEHNAALHLVDARGRLVQILDYDAAEQALAAALDLARADSTLAARAAPP